MTKVGVRELKNQLSQYLARVKRGEVLAVTQRGREIAFLFPASSAAIPKKLTEMISAGFAAWKGGKPSGSQRPAPVRGRQVSRIVIEDRR